jgi:phosphomannomutase / phosphoglucomutase
MRIGDPILARSGLLSWLAPLLAIAGTLFAPLAAAADEARADAERVEKVISAYITEQSQKLKEIAADPELPGLLRSGDAAALAAKADALLKAKAPDAFGLRLFPRSAAEVDASAAMPIGYGSLAMITQAEGSDAPISAEVQVFGTPGQHLALVQRVADAEGVAGVAYLGVRLDSLEKAIAGINTESLVEIRQATGGASPWVIAASRKEAPPADIAVQTMPVANSMLQLAFWSRVAAAPAPGATQSAPAGEPVAAGGGVSSLLPWLALLLLPIGAAIWWVKRPKPEPAPVGESSEYRGAIAAIMQGAYPGVEQLVPRLPPRTGGTTSTAREKEMMASIASRAAAAAGVEPRNAGVTVEEEAPITTVMKAPAVPPPKPAAEAGSNVPPASIFRAYDIRGVVGETLTLEGVYLIGKAIGSEAGVRGQSAIVVGRDGRNSSPKYAEALAKGIRDSGRDVIDIGMVPTPVLYFATHFLDIGNGVMLTGSHNPPNYNGLKIVLDGQALSGDAIQALRRRIANADFTSGEGMLESTDIVPEYIQRITEDIPLALDRTLRIVCDCGNGVAGAVAPRLFTALGHDVIELCCEVDGNFPNHHPDPSQPDNLRALIATVKENQADLGLAFDGDGDRLGVVDNAGNIIWPDRQMMLYARDVLSRNPGAEIIFDVKCSRQLLKVIKQAGGKPVMWKTGHSFIKAKMRESGAPLAGEMSGHIFFKERWYGFDDAMYTAARLIEILVGEGGTAQEVFAALPGGIATPELRIDMPEARHAEFMQKLIANARFEGAHITTIDGLRVDVQKAWGLIRPSNTTPVLVLRFEGDDAAALADMQAKFRDLITGIDPSLKLPF